MKNNTISIIDSFIKKNIYQPVDIQNDSTYKIDLINSLFFSIDEYKGNILFDTIYLYVSRLIIREIREDKLLWE